MRLLSNCSTSEFSVIYENVATPSKIWHLKHSSPVKVMELVKNRVMNVDIEIPGLLLHV